MYFLVAHHEGEFAPLAQLLELAITHAEVGVAVGVDVVHVDAVVVALLDIAGEGALHEGGVLRSDVAHRGSGKEFLCDEREEVDDQSHD